MMMRFKWLLLLLLVPVFLVRAADNEALITQGNLDYKMRNYKKAAESYEKVLASGVESSEVYFNLGNAYFKLNNLPEAILYFEKARKLNPGDDDIRFNLKIVNSRIVDKIEALPEMFYKRWFTLFRSFFSVDQWAQLSIIAFFLFFTGTAIYLLAKPVLFRKLGFWLGMIMLIFAIMSFISSYKGKQALSNQKEAIIFAPVVTVKSSPDEASIDMFVIHEGTKVTVNDEIGEWYKILLANGSVGWMPRADLRLI